MPKKRKQQQATDQKEKVKRIKRAIGRQDWGGVKPVTQVIPDKKKPKPHRKRKHKGRHEDAGHFFIYAQGQTQSNPAYAAHM